MKGKFIVLVSLFVLMSFLVVDKVSIAKPETPSSSELITIDFEVEPGPDGLLDTEDDIPLSEMTIISDQFADLGVNFSLIPDGLPFIATEGPPRVAFAGSYSDDNPTFSGKNSLTDGSVYFETADAEKDFSMMFDTPVSFVGLQLIDFRNDSIDPDGHAHPGLSVSLNAYNEHNTLLASDTYTTTGSEPTDFFLLLQVEANSITKVELIGTTGDGGIAIDDFTFSTEPLCGNMSDEDADGIPFGYELCGYDYNEDGSYSPSYDGNPDVDLPAMGADPDKKDVFVEIDYMESNALCIPFSYCTPGHSHKPKPEAINRVVQVFYEHDINLHVDYGPESVMNPTTDEKWGDLSEADPLPHYNEIGSVDNEGYNWNRDDTIDCENVSKESEIYFDDFKHCYFLEARKPTFHYAVFAHHLGGLNCHGGISRDEIPSDFIVSLGGWGLRNPWFSCKSVFYQYLVGSEIEQATTFMHELGHNLGLSHGGPLSLVGDETHFEYKPNYLSIMNPSFSIRGLIKDNRFGYLDYSNFSSELDLDETNLNEADGLKFVSSADYGTKYWCYSNEEKRDFDVVRIDWNCDGDDNDKSVSTDINKDSVCIRSGPDKTLNTIVAGDDIVVGLTIRDGDDRTCDTTASGDDVQVRKVGHIQQNILNSYNDWENMNLALIGDFDLALDIPVGTENSTGVEQITYEEDALLTTEYGIAVTAPGRAWLQPGGSITYTIEVHNLGINDDIYNITASSSRGWADLSGIPSSVMLLAETSIEYTISVDIPDNAEAALVDEIVFSAVSQTNSLTRDSLFTVIGVANQLYLPAILQSD